MQVAVLLLQLVANVHFEHRLPVAERGDPRLEQPAERLAVEDLLSDVEVKTGHDGHRMSLRGLALVEQACVVGQQGDLNAVVEASLARMRETCLLTVGTLI